MKLAPHDRLHGYCVKRVETLSEIDAVFIELIHEATSARHIHIHTPDRENTFGVAFKTVPTDSTGVAHILEHTALCGSRTYNVRDPFFSMLKRGLSTFMNAFTASDWTMYPFSTQNAKDYYNLMDVYLDAAFFPKLDRLSFKQEGHRLEFSDAPETPGDIPELVYKGVVYNEMKGAMSSPDQVLSRSLLAALYPQTTYRHNSGGDPAQIPSLTHEDLIAFHRRHYHPSNAFFYTYGDLPVEDHLRFIAGKVLTEFARIDPGTDVPSQSRWTSPKTVVQAYPLDRDEDPRRKHQVCLAWLMTDIQDPFEVLVLTILEQILLGNSGSPLRKALIDSGLGSSLSDHTGFDADNRDTLFACGLKDTAEADAPRIEALILDTLKDLADNGIDAELVTSAIHQIEFHRKEKTNSPYPYGLRLLLTLLGTWLHKGDPLRSLQVDADLERLNAELTQGPFLENRIRRYFLDNPHRVRFVLKPDPDMAACEAGRIAAELQERKKRLTPEEIEQIKADTVALRELQDAKEDVSSLPTLEIADIPPEIECIAATAAASAPETSAYQRSTSGIFYLAAGAGLAGLPRDLIPLVPFACRSLPRMGTTARDYEDVARRIDLFTGGIAFSPRSRTRAGEDPMPQPYVALNAKSLNRNQDKMFEIVQELVTSVNFHDPRRLKNLLLEYKAGLESMVVQNGHRLAMMLASRNFSASCALSEIWHGVHQLQYIKKIAAQITDTSQAEDILAELAQDLTSITQRLFSKGNLKMALIGDDAALKNGAALTSDFGNTLKPGQDGFGPLDITPGDDLPKEGWSTQTAVSFVAASFQTIRLGHDDAPALALIAKMLRSLFLHREIREKGGAYGGFAVYDHQEGVFSFGSYRDPHIVNTLEVYRRAFDFIQNGGFTRDDVKEAILQVCSDIDKPDPPGPAARKAFWRKLIGMSDELRIAFKSRLLEMDPEAVMQAAQTHFLPAANQLAVAVISSDVLLDKANQKSAGHLLRPHKI